MPPVARCVYCREQPAAPAWHPFCSERCKMADLGRWLGGHYRVPGAPLAPPGSNEPDDEDAGDEGNH